jgi:hypothetical protein
MLLALLPKDPDGLPKLEMTLNLENLANWISLLHPAEVDLVLNRRPAVKMAPTLGECESETSLPFRRRLFALDDRQSNCDERTDQS